MYGVLGEDNSDAATLKALIRRLADDEMLSVQIWGARGCGELLNRGAQRLKLLSNLGCKRFIVCHDADGNDVAKIRKRIDDKVIRPSGVNEHCIVVPVQELEAWILADIEKVSRIFKSWKPAAIRAPESIRHAKEHLEKLS